VKGHLGLRLVFLFSLFVCLNSCTQYTENLKLDDNHVYLILRSDDSKVSSKIRDYNLLKDSLYSHIGILLAEENKRVVYHMHPDSNKEHLILKEDLTDFLKFKKNKLDYYSISLIKDLSKVKLKNILEKEIKKTNQL